MTEPDAMATLVSREPLSLITGDGAELLAPIRVVVLRDGRLGCAATVSTDAAARLAADPRVELRPCDTRGRVAEGAASYAGVAELVRSGAAFTEVQGRVRATYGPVARAITRWRGPTYDAVVLVSLDAG